MIASIIIPNWNGIKFIEVCLRSVLASDFDQEFEVVVVDNGSSDGSRELIYEKFPSVKVLEEGYNSGFAKACNDGIKASSGEYIILLNNDIEVETSWLKELVGGMQRHSECGMGTSKMVQYDNRSQIYNTGDQFRIYCEGGGRGFGEIDAGQYEKEDYVFGACAGAGIYRRSLFEKIGFFDEQFFIFAEDVDINLRAQLIGERCVYFPSAIVYHWGTATVGFNSDRHVFLFLRNDLFVLLKNYKFTELLKYFTKIAGSIFEGGITYSLAGQGWTVLKSRISFLFFLPCMAWKRMSQVAARKRMLKDIPEILK